MGAQEPGEHGAEARHVRAAAEIDGVDARPGLELGHVAVDERGHARAVAEARREAGERELELTRGVGALPRATIGFASIEDQPSDGLVGRKAEE